tara:strand:- start:407 stop:643 length:237 start_codon:yes stop_codon:yes gene_type:complete
MKYLIIILAFTLSILLILLNLIKYKSAFEADQSCHYDLSMNSIELASQGCDHDLETNQWILYEKSKNNKAKVLKRYRY